MKAILSKKHHFHDVVVIPVVQEAGFEELDIAAEQALVKENRTSTRKGFLWDKSDPIAKYCWQNGQSDNVIRMVGKMHLF